MIEFNGKQYEAEDLNDRQKYLLNKVVGLDAQIGQLMLEKEVFFNSLKQELEKENG
jgi:hypothetical protein